VPALIADAGDQAAWGYVEFFTANIRNPMGAHESPRTTKLYNRTKERLAQQEVERIIERALERLLLNDYCATARTTPLEARRFVRQLRQIAI
jgi:hypothetical protein